MRLGLSLAISVSLLFGPAQAQASHYPDSDLLDVAGDANLLNQARVYIVSDPASYAAADLVSVDLQTDYVAVPVGEAGTDYRPTALRVVFRTKESPSAVLSGDEIVYRLEATGWSVSDKHADVFMEVVVAKSPAGTVTTVPRLRRCLGGAESPDTCWTRSRPEWTAVIDDGAKKLTLTYPFSSLAADEADWIGVGGYLGSPDAETQWPRLSLDPYYPGHRQTIDMALYGHGYVVGEDVPQDVGCTQECEGTDLGTFGEFFFEDDTLNHVIHVLSSIDGAGKSPDVHNVKIWTTTKRCPSDAPCSEEAIARECEGLRCGEKLTIPYDPAEEAEYSFVFKWEFDDGDSFRLEVGRICHRGLLSGCAESQTRLVRF